MTRMRHRIGPMLRHSPQGAMEEPSQMGLGTVVLLKVLMKEARTDDLEEGHPMVEEA